MTIEENPMPTAVRLELPQWIHQMEAEWQKAYPGDEDKMRLAIELSIRNVRESTGGPFGAAIFDSKTGKVVSIGVNRVVPLNNSTAHAEMMAFMLAQTRLQRFRLNARDHRFVLATSAQPCAMCYGACPWAGIDRVLIGARREDVESLTEFEEGPMPRNWIRELQRRGVAVTRDVLRREACKAFLEYEGRRGTRY